MSRRAVTGSTTEGPRARRFGAAVSAAALVGLVLTGAAVTTAAAGATAVPATSLTPEPGQTPEPSTIGPVPENCNGIAPTSSSGKNDGPHDKQINSGQGLIQPPAGDLNPNTFETPGTTVHWLVQYPVTKTSSSFDIRDCVVEFLPGNTSGILGVPTGPFGEILPGPGDTPTVKGYDNVLDNAEFDFADGQSLPGEFDYSWVIPANIPVGSVICNYAKDTGGGSAGKGKNRKEGACFGVQAAPPTLSISKAADKSPVSSGDQVGFSIDVGNAGPGPATNLTVTDTLPFLTGVVWSVASPAVGCGITGTGANQVLSCLLPTLDANAADDIIHVTGTTTAATSGVLPNIAHVKADKSSTVDSNQASVTVNPPDLVITKTPKKDPVSSGDPVGFTITVTNEGLGIARAVTLTDNPLPGNTGVDWTATTNVGCPIAGAVGSQSVDCGSTIGDLAPAASFSFDVTGTTTTNTVGILTNTATADATNAVNSVQATGKIHVNAPGLSITKVADKSEVSSGDPIGFTITVENTGDGAANGLTLSDPLPGDTSVVWSLGSATPPGTCTVSVTNPQTLSCTSFSLGSGATDVIHVTATTTAATSGLLTNTASLHHGDTTLPSTDTVQVDQPSLSVTKTPDNPTVTAGSPVGFVIVFKNSGPGIARSTTLTDPLPSLGGTNVWSLAAGAPASCVITSQVLNCTALGDLGVGQFVTMHITGTTSAATAASIVNTATGDATNVVNPVMGTGTIGVTPVVTPPCTTCGGGGPSPIPELTILKAGPATVKAGANITYTVTVSSTGSGPATNVVMTDPTPGGTTFVSESQTSGPTFVCTNPPVGSAGTTSCTLASMDNGTTAVFSIVDLVPAGTADGTQLANTATVVASSVPPVSSTVTTTVSNPPAPPVVLGITGSQTPPVTPPPVVTPPVVTPPAPVVPPAVLPETVATLPFTGANSSRGVLLALGLLLFGTCALVIGRRPRPARIHARR